MRDSEDKAITICGMENVDPVGVHTGDSIVVAPIMTLNDSDLKMLNDSAIKIIRELKIEGGCNVQFALHPKTSEYYLIEVNPESIKIISPGLQGQRISYSKGNGQDSRWHDAE